MPTIKKVEQVIKVEKVDQGSKKKPCSTCTTCTTFTTFCRGFTLIELLVVISIIGILISLSAVAFQSSRASARDAKRRADLEEIRSGLEIYRTDCGKYPAALNFGAPLTGDGSSSSCSLANTYLPKVPQDPQSPSYQYNYSPSGSTYALCSHLESQQNSVSGCGSCGPNGPAACRYKVESP